MKSTGSRRVLVVVDMEGATGIHDYRQVYSLYDEYWQEGRQLLTEDVNAAVRGLFRGGATQVSVLDNHGDQKNVVPEQIDPRANLLPKPIVRPTAQGVWPALLKQLQEPPDALVLVGYHARSGTPRAFLPHTMNPEFEMSVNGRPLGEIGFNIGCAGEKGVPVILITGDVAACAEARDLVPGIASAPTKSATAPDTAELIPQEESWQRIETAAEKGMRSGRDIAPLQMKTPIAACVTFPTPEHAANAAMIPESRWNGDSMVTYESPSFGQTTLAVSAMTKLALTVRVASEMSTVLQVPAARERLITQLEARLEGWLRG